MGKKKNSIKFVCEKCGKEPEPDKKKSNENWKVINHNKPCKYCGGKLKLEF